VVALRLDVSESLSRLMTMEFALVFPSQERIWEWCCRASLGRTAGAAVPTWDMRRKFCKGFHRGESRESADLEKSPCRVEIYRFETNGL
jgi:hypothetical protein